MKTLSLILRRYVWILLMLAQAPLHAQSLTVTGRVLDGETSEGLPGATVLEVGTSNGVITDVSGNFSITVAAGAQLSISYVGYITQTLPAQADMSVQLALDVSALNEVVVIGYGTTTQKELTGAISKVTDESIMGRSVPRLDQALQGQLAGVSITTNSGAPGGSSNIRIRGLTSNGDNNPLILVDGVVYDAAGLNALNPADIESVNVLKDATAGIYGVRAANGVILIETKKGRLNSKPTLEVSGYMGVQQTSRKLDLLNAEEYAILKNEAFVAGGQPAPFANTSLGEGTDWQDAVFQNAPISNYNISVTGGTEKTTYNIGGSVFGQEGIVGGPKANFERINGRFNISTELAPKLRLTNVLLYTNEKSSTIPENGIGSVLYNAANAYPTEPVWLEEENRYSYLERVSDIINPVAQIENQYNWARVNKITGKEELEYTINDKFKVTGRAGYNYALVDSKVFSPLVWYGPSKAPNTAANEDLDPVILTIGDLEIERGASITESRNTFLDFNFEGFVNYSETFGNHTVKGTFGASYFGTSAESLTGVAFNIPNNSRDLADISANQADGGYLNNTFSYQVKSRLISHFIRAEYDFQKRYLFSATLRRDGSTRFGENNRIGYFPSVAGAWVISEESFFTPSFIDFAKLRVSYGISGNDRIGDFAYRATLGGEGVYVFNDALSQGVAIGRAGNPDLKWETTEQINIGADITFLENWDLTANYFVKNTRDLLFQPDVLSVLGTYGAGATPPVINGGNVRNSGLELDLGYGKESASGLGIFLNANLTLINNEVTEVPPGFGFIPGAPFSVGGSVATRFEAGFPIGYFVGYKTNGIWQTQEEIDNSDVVQANAQPGDLRFADIDGDGVISFGDDSDRTMIGSPIPDFTIGFNVNLTYKGFDFAANVFGAFGQEIIRNYERQQPYANQLSYNLNRWTGPGSTNEYPRLTTGLTQNTVFSDFYVEDGSFVRLRTVQLGYTLPVKLSKYVGAQSFRVYVAANNLVTLTKYMGYDPDVGSGNPLGAGVDNGMYPQARVFMGGFNIKF